MEIQKREPATRFTLEGTPFTLSRVFLCTESKNEPLGCDQDARKAERLTFGSMVLLDASMGRLRGQSKSQGRSSALRSRWSHSTPDKRIATLNRSGIDARA
jgi:hypothetical protein